MTRRLLSILIAGMLALCLPFPGTTSLEAQGLTEGLAVHGDWIIDIKNPDGTLVLHRQFTNHLHTTGAVGLAHVLDGRASISKWRVKISIGQNSYYLDEPNGPQSGTADLPLSTLGRSMERTTTPGSSEASVLVFTGTVKAVADGQIFGVETQPSVVCAAGGLPTCPAGTNTFTTKQLYPEVIQVKTGQLVQVTVKLSFPAGT